MTRPATSIGLAVCLAGTTLGATAQSTLTLYGTVDEYLNCMSSSSGTKVKALEDGQFLRSRLGFKGLEDLGSGCAMKFQLETGLTDTIGATADTTRFFDRQSWVGLATPFGEIRAGRQNTAVF